MFNIKRLQDIQVPDKTLREQYYQKFFNGDVVGAQNLYNNNPQLQGKCINSAILNSLLDSILTLEGYYDVGVTQFLTSKLNEFNLNINNLIYVDEWSELESYEVNNFVLYDNDIYFCIKTTTAGILPTNTTYWLKLGLHGDKGVIGLGVNYIGGWDSSVIYNKFDMVVYQNKLYIAKSSVTGELPTNTAYWFKGLEVLTQGIYISGLPPFELPIDTIWFRDIDGNTITWATYEDYKWNSLREYSWGDIERGVF